VLGVINQMTYIAKRDTWFKEGTTATLEEDYSDPSKNYFAGVFKGTYVVGSCNPEGYDEFWYAKGYKNGDEVEMRELCGFEEFEIHP
jgi:hypothetical protein